MANYKSSRKWINQHINDPYVKLAQQKGYRSRAAFKLIELLETENLSFHNGARVIDLGSAPGSWSQVMHEKLSKSNGALDSRIIALDLLPMDPLPGVEFIQGDFLDQDIIDKLEKILSNQLVDIVISDMAPNLSGIRDVDSMRICNICELALNFAVNHLKKNGVIIIKSFHGSGFSQIVYLYKKFFKRVLEFKPKSSRFKSSETFLIARNLK
ncbi:ribosomal RNA large subunit methyltransferase E [Candidatus Kinetoplastibacterium oncopeltii TCC290E]|uniref:Ribosomal RNA large subunit methyltransferase E n=1 Tax=Candidatus Kinetoplastidibacterium stringomonadis TCC290E TaxID=1208920 RepID=M1LYD7_9PROT|nr:RlmE family RNA methyltransferase [Candidatus Kinetoplastibacterium oncopeltii]AGF48169.1 ribosomal RNA large subunit methyltransferase E [Candidatus Kinetoplastibacterium oncopeltii TCC290E]